MHDAFSVLVIAERLQRQGEQVRFFFGEHGRDLSFGRAMDARVGPALFPAVQIGLRFLETLKALPLERCFLRVADPGLHFSFSIWIMDPASERSEEHTSELQSLRHLVCRLLLEKKKKKRTLLIG